MGNIWALTPFRLVFVGNPCYVSDIHCQKLDPVGPPSLSDGKWWPPCLLSSSELSEPQSGSASWSRRAMEKPWKNPQIFRIDQWEFQDPKMEVLYHIRPYFECISPCIGLIYGRYLQFRILEWPLNWSSTMKNNENHRFIDGWWYDKRNVRSSTIIYKSGIFRSKVWLPGIMVIIIGRHPGRINTAT